MMCSEHCPRCTGHTHRPLSLTAERLCFSVCPRPQPFAHTSMLSSNVTSSVKLSLASWVKLIMAFLPSLPPLCPYINHCNSFPSASQYRGYLHPSILCMLKGKVRDFKPIETDPER